jgi:carboxymethylenebutenolidase
MAVMPHEGTHTIIFGTIAVPVGSALFDGYLARPDQGDPAPTVVVLHGVEGITPETKDLCRVLARQGWVVLAPDWFRGTGAPIADTRAIAVVDEAVEFLASDDLPYADAARPAVVGVGAGARLGLLYADHNRSVSAVIAVEPTLGDDVADALSSIGAPVLGFFGADDESVEVDDVDALQAGTPNGQWIVYEGVGAGFLDAGSEGFHAGAERDALARTVRVLGAALS